MPLAAGGLRVPLALCRRGVPLAAGGLRVPVAHRCEPNEDDPRQRAEQHDQRIQQRHIRQRRGSPAVTRLAAPTTAPASSRVGPAQADT